MPTPPEWHTAYLGLGANLCDRLTSLRRAVDLLQENPCIVIDRDRDLTSVYETSPVDAPGDQPDYLNTVARVSTTLTPLELLDAMQEIEAVLGRVRQARNEARVIDIDILLYGDLFLNDIRLTLPHPRLHERRFVLEPLVELAPDMIHPILRRTIRDLASRAALDHPTKRVRPVLPKTWPSTPPPCSAGAFSVAPLQ